MPQKRPARQEKKATANSHRLQNHQTPSEGSGPNGRNQAGVAGHFHQSTRLIAGALIVLAIVLHVVLAIAAATTKSATFDEPLHVLGGLIQWRYDDYRLNPEHPPLWKHLAALATAGIPFQVDLGNPESRVMLQDLNRQERWAIDALFRSPTNDGPQLIARARLGMLPFGAMVVLLVAWWARQLAGNVAGVVASWLAALDPNLLGHSGLVTNDVACTAALLACFLMAWNVACKASWLNLILFSVACGIAAVTKFTTLALPLFLVPVLALRLAQSRDWLTWAGSSISTLKARLLAVFFIIAFAGSVSICFIWAAYGFRYRPCVDPELGFRLDHPSELYQFNLQQREANGGVKTEVIENSKATLLQQACNWANHYQLLPQAFLQGMAYAQAMSIVGVSFLDGQLIHGGTSSYFLRAWLYKTPMTLLLALSLSCVWLVWWVMRDKPQFRIDFAYWILPYCLVVVVGLSYDLNIGLRHMLPAFPVIWIGLAAIFARMWPNPLLRKLVVVLLVSFAVESLSAYPNYVAYFNIASAQQQGLDRLSDSNLDWGQDLIALKRWQQQNPSAPLYLAYFGSADPAAYGIEYTNVPPGYLYGPQPVDPDPQRPGVLAISATWLQGNYLHWLDGTFLDPREVRQEMDIIRQRAQPMKVLGGSIYLYEYPLQLKEEYKK